MLMKRVNFQINKRRFFNNNIYYSSVYIDMITKRKGFLVLIES